MKIDINVKIEKDDDRYRWSIDSNGQHIEHASGGSAEEAKRMVVAYLDEYLIVGNESDSLEFEDKVYDPGY